MKSINKIFASLHEAQELTSEQPYNRVWSDLIDMYRNNPSIPPSRNIMENFYKNNSKFASHVKYSDILALNQNTTYAKTLEDIVNKFYLAPDCQSKKILLDFINNQLDLNNITFISLLQDFGPSLLFLGGGKKIISSLFSGTKKAAGATAKQSGSLSKTIGKTMIGGTLGLGGKSGNEKPSKIPKNFGASNIDSVKEGIFIPLLLTDLIDGVLYGDSYVASTLVNNGLLPNDVSLFIKNWKGVFPNAKLASYYNVFIGFSLIIYEWWDYLMGKKYYNDRANIIQDPNSTYIKEFKNTFFQDADLAKAFDDFMMELKNASDIDKKNIDMFSECPFFITDASIIIEWNDGNITEVSSQNLPQILSQYALTHVFYKVSENHYKAEFNQNRGFSPLMAFGVNTVITARPDKIINVTWDNGKTTQNTLSQIQNWSLNDGGAISYKIDFENITKGGDELKLKLKPNVENIIENIIIKYNYNENLEDMNEFYSIDFYDGEEKNIDIPKNFNSIKDIIKFLNEKKLSPSVFNITIWDKNSTDFYGIPEILYNTNLEEFLYEREIITEGKSIRYVLTQAVYDDDGKIFDTVDVDTKFVSISEILWFLKQQNEDYDDFYVKSSIDNFHNKVKLSDIVRARYEYYELN